MTRTQRLFRWIPAALSALSGAVLLGIAALLVFGQPVYQQYYQGRSLLSNLILWPFALLGCGALLWLRTREKRSSQRLWPMRAAFAAALVVQLLVARTCWGHLGWDAGVVHATAEAIARGEAWPDPTYFVSCPNNAPITMLMVPILWLAVKIGLGVPYVVLPYVDAVLLNLSAYACHACVRTLTRSTAARGLSLTLSIGWIALSPYIVYPYTDVFSILFPVLALYAFLHIRRTGLRWLAVSLLCFFGGAIKPTVLIFFIALVLVSLCRFIAAKDFSRDVWKKAAAVCAAILIGALPGKLFQDGATTYLAGSATPEQQLSMTHYLMLGMNDTTMGGHSVPDVEFTLSFPTLREAQSANLRRAWERVASRGLWGNVEFFSIKAYKAYADGSFASHGSFLEVELPRRTDALSVFLRELYNRKGDWMPYCQTLVQCLWLGVLMLCGLAAIRSRRHPTVALLALTLLGLTAYLLLFEVWPRYLFLFAPFFVILSAMALDKPLR